MSRSIHEAAHGIMAIRFGFLHYLHLHPGRDKGGFARCVGRTPIGQLMIHLAGMCGVWQVSPFTRSVPIAGLPVPAASGLKTGPEIHEETEKALCDRGLPPTNSNDLPHDDDRFSAAIEALAQAGA